MQTLTEAECLSWLAEHRIPADPYSSSYGPETFGRVPFIEQASLPQHRTEVFLRLIENLSSCRSALMHVIDWGLYTPDEMSVFDACRKAHGENWRLIESPGHLFQQFEFKLFAGMLALVKYYGWVAYAYFDDGTTALVWKGDFLDLWAYEEGAFQSGRHAFARCGLHITEKKPASSHPHPG
jgi:hypothetical protein